MNLDDYLDPDKKGTLEIDWGKFLLHVVKELEFQKQISIESLILNKALLERQKGNVDNDEIINMVNEILDKIRTKAGESLPSVISSLSK